MCFMFVRLFSVLCFPVCILCILLEMDLSECGVCSISVPVLIS